MALNQDDIDLVDADPAELSPMERGRLRALGIGMDRIEVEQRQQRMRDAAADATDSSYDKGMARGRASGRASTYTVAITGGAQRDSKID